MMLTHEVQLIVAWMLAKVGKFKLLFAYISEFSRVLGNLKGSDINLICVLTFY